MMGGGGGGVVQDFSASNQFANIARDQWNNYRQVYQPQENKLLASVETPQNLNDALQYADQSTNSAFNAEQGSMAQNLARYGVKPTPAQQQQTDATLALDKASALAGNENAARQHSYDARLAIMAGGLSAPKSQFTTGAL